MIEQNSTEKNESQLRVESIIGKSKKNGKLLKADETEMIELMKSIFSDRQNWNQGLEYLLNLPAESAAAVLINVWELQNDQNQLVLLNEFLKKDKNPNTIIKQLYFINELIKRSPNLGLEALHTVSIKVTDFGEKIPNKKILTTCSKTIIVNEDFLTITLKEHPIKKVDFPSTALLLISTLLQYWENGARSAKELKIVHKLISWISLNGSRVEFKRSLKAELQERADSLDAESQSILLNLGFINTITENRTAAPIVEMQQSDMMVAADSKKISTLREDELMEKTAEIKEVQTQDISSLPKEVSTRTTTVLKEEQVSSISKGEHLLKQLRIYLGGLETTNHKLQESLKTITNEVNSEKSKRQQLKTTVDELQKDLSDKRREITILIGQINHLNAELERMRQKSIKKEEEYQVKLQSLIDMAERETVFVKDEFKNKLSSRLRLEHQDFMDILSEEMTVDLGENLRAQLENIFRLLKQEGMNF